MLSSSLSLSYIFIYKKSINKPLIILSSSFK
nr:MAG TPA: hypothetical protein [Caudoviricetes sp.]